MKDAFGNEVMVGDLIAVAYRPNNGNLVLEHRRVVFVSSVGVWYQTHHRKTENKGSSGPQMRQAREPIYRIKETQ